MKVREALETPVRSIVGEIRLPVFAAVEVPPFFAVWQYE